MMYLLDSHSVRPALKERPKNTVQYRSLKDSHVEAWLCFVVSVRADVAGLRSVGQITIGGRCTGVQCRAATERHQASADHRQGPVMGRQCAEPIPDPCL